MRVVLGEPVGQPTTMDVKVAEQLEGLAALVREGHVHVVTWYGYPAVILSGDGFRLELKLAAAVAREAPLPWPMLRTDEGVDTA